ncbi:MAG TPA: carboxypeptidase-like regulatory domain-containing protein, partial [Blastocatellia bacterium]|nr:carboxypeptidase-like regulatory domain-containing protein [Blastocatellia bacterium]
MRRLASFLTALLISANLVLVVTGQVTGGGIHGLVRNQLGEPVAGARVTAVNTGTNQSRTTTTDEEGRYRLPSLAIGTYEITIDADKYQAKVQQVTLRVNEDAAVEAELQAAGSNEQTTIVGVSAPMTETTTSVLGLVIENKQIMELPLNGRNFLQLGSLVANVNSTPSLHSGSEGGARNGPFAVAGQRDRSLT